jgi:serine/threonine-protein kinase
MATVYEADDTELNRRVAIKVLHPQLAADSAFLARFKREKQAQGPLKHPGIVQLYDVGDDGGRPYIVEELVDGQSLKDVIRNTPLPLDRIIDIGVQMAKALDYAHQAGVIHRDVKPQNILVSPNGEAKLVDFGIAVSAGVQGATDTGAVFGTAHYLAPEQAQGEPATPATDLYSLGVVLYEMATGQPPFDGQTAIEIANKHISAAPEPPSITNPTIPPRLEAAILRTLSKDPAKRPRSAGELARELLQADDLLDRTTVQMQRMPAAPRTGATRAQPRQPVQRRYTVLERTSEGDWWPIIVLAVLASVLVLGLIPVWSAVLSGLRA